MAQGHISDHSCVFLAKSVILFLLFFPPTANCVQGFYSPGDTLPCLACPVGTFKTVIGNQNCTACDSGFTTTGVASTAFSNCSVSE